MSDLIFHYGSRGGGKTLALDAAMRDWMFARVTAPRVLYAEPDNDACDSVYCIRRECNGVIKVCNDGEKILCKCSCHRKATQ